MTRRCRVIRHYAGIDITECLGALSRTVERTYDIFEKHDDLEDDNPGPRSCDCEAA
jgi:hypothetical protein